MKRLFIPIILCALGLSPLSVKAERIRVATPYSMMFAMQDIAKQYERAHPNATVQLEIAGSRTLLQRLSAGSQFDVLATADQTTMDRAAALGLIDGTTRRDFARNVLVVAVPAGQSTRVKSLADLKNPRFKRVLVVSPEYGAVGEYAQSALKKANAWDAVQAKAVYSTSLTQSMDLLEFERVDAGLVYETDVRSRRGKVRTELYVKTDTSIRYPVAICKCSRDMTESKRFVAYLKGSTARRILHYYGFQTD